MNPITTIVVLTVLLALLAYNLIMEMNKTDHDTIGDVVITVIRQEPILVFAAGLLAGHLFWSQ